jgi:ribosomal protein S18 acetylase RimI-like enzyme
VTIRPATESDRDQLRELWLAFAEEVGGPPFLRTTWENTWSDLRRHIDDGLGFVAEENGAPIGFVFAIVPSKTPDLGHVVDLYVVPQARRHGIGRALMARIGAAFDERGIGHVGLDVRVDNAAAGAFYDRLGFVVQERFVTTSVPSLQERLAAAGRPKRSFGSTHVQTDDETSVERAVARFLPRLGGSAGAKVTPARNGWVTVYDELCDEDRTAHRRLGAELSERLGTPAVALRLEEAAVVRYYLFERGRMVDEYLSVPTYYGELSKADEISLAANATLVARLTGADPARVRAVARTASSTADLPPAGDLLAEIAAVMGLEVEPGPAGGATTAPPTGS